MKFFHKTILLTAIFLLFGIFTTIFSDKAHAATYCDGNPEGNCYVDGSVEASGDGKTPETAFKTIQEAADVVGPGDTVNVRGGMTYTGINSCTFFSSVVCPVNSGSSGNYITYQAWQGTGLPVINGAGARSSFNTNLRNYLIISGFEIKNSGGIGSSVCGILMVDGDNLIIKNNIIHDITGGSSTNMGIYNFWGTNKKIYNNFLYNNSYTGFHVDGGVATSGIVLKNNVITNNEYGITGTTDVTLIVDYNIVWGNTLANYLGRTAGFHDISADPLFTDPNNGDFRLQAGSPAINVGATLPEVTTDILGIARPQGSAYDIGAYEYYDIPVTLAEDTSETFDTSTPTFIGTVSTVSTGTIVMIEYSIDGGDWTTEGVSPTDGAFDESEEEFSITVPYELSQGEHTIQIRATDSYGNTSYSTMYASLDFEIEEAVVEEEIEELPETGSNILLLLPISIIGLIGMFFVRVRKYLLSILFFGTFLLVIPKAVSTY